MRKYSTKPPRCISVWKAFKYVTIPLWFIIVPLGVIYFWISLPFRIMFWLCSGCKRRKNTPMKVEIVECTNPKDN